MKYFLLFFIALLPCSLIGQDLQTYKGPYANGFAEYTYYQNSDMTRSFHGQFKFTTGRNDGFFIQGSYVNNKKEGHGLLICGDLTRQLIIDRARGQVLINFRIRMKMWKSGLTR